MSHRRLHAVGAAIHRIEDGRTGTFAEGAQLEHLHGLRVEGDILVVAAWGQPEADFSTRVPGHLYRLNLATGAKTLISTKPTGNLDGLESDGRGGHIVSDRMSGKVCHIAGNGDTRSRRGRRRTTCGAGPHRRSGATCDGRGDGGVAAASEPEGAARA